MAQRAEVLEEIRTRVKTKEGSVVARFRALDETGVMVLLEDYKPYPMGTVFVPNRQLAKETENRTTHMAYDGLYEAFRGGKHTVRHGGALPKGVFGEVQALQEDVQTARSYVRVLLSSGLLTEEEDRLVQHAQRTLIKSLEPKRNEHKTTAREQFLRGMQKRDALGRVNPSAAGFVTGAAIGHLLERTEDVRRITARVDKRTIAIYSDIDRHMELYNELRSALKPRTSPDQVISIQSPLDRLVLLLDPNRGGKGMEETVKILEGFIQAFNAVKVLPFRKNADFTRLDLMDAVTMAEICDRRKLREQYAKIRRGIGWVYAQQYLECEIIAPLSFLTEDLLRVERSKRRKAPSTKPLRIVRAMAPDAFTKLELSLAVFQEKISYCSDEGLRQPVKDRVKDLLDRYRTAVNADDWKEAKRLLKVASALL